MREYGHRKEPWGAKLPAILVVCVLLVSIHCFSFMAITKRELWLNLDKLTTLVVVAAFLLLRRPKTPPIVERKYGMFVNILVVLTFATFIPLFLVEGQSPISSFNIQYAVIYWLLYSILQDHRVPQKFLINLTLLLGTTWAVITIGQQFTYPHYLFYSRLNTDPGMADIEYRSGIYRYMVEGMSFLFLATFIVFNRYLNTGKVKYLVGTGFLVVGNYFGGTRQTLVTSAAGMAFMLVAYIAKKRLKLPAIYLFIATTMAIGGFLVADQVFGKLVATTQEDATKDNIRLVSYKYFFFDHWHSPINYFLGNGMPKYFSPAGDELRALAGKGLFQTDVGMVGVLSVYGIFYVLTAIGVLLYGSFRPMGSDKLYINGMFFTFLVAIPLAPLFFSGAEAPFFCLLFLLAEKPIDANAPPVRKYFG